MRMRCWLSGELNWCGWSVRWRLRGLVVPDPLDATLEQRFVKIAECGDRVLKVVVNKMASPERVVSAYFDRRMKGAL
jgi:hypothetical protein